SVVMIALMGVLDPHLTLRAEADLFFTMLAVGAAAVPFMVGNEAPHRRWRTLLDWRWQPAGVALLPAYPGARLQIAEAGDDDDTMLDPAMAALVENRLTLSVRADGRQLGTTTLVLCRDRARLHGIVTKPVDAVDHEASALVWRAVALCADSLRLKSLHTASSVGPDRNELRSAGRLAKRAEGERSSMGLGPRSASERRNHSNEGDPPPVRLNVGTRLPRWKRAVDITVGTICLGVSAPLWAVCAAAIRRTSPGPILFRQVRIGAGGLPFQLYKFRTMYVDNDDSAHRESNRKELLEGAEAAKLDRDSRVTKAGHWLRRLSLDELPQILNVLRSEMSLVGPRPSLLWEVELFDPSRRRRLNVHPGMTGLWQISGRADVSMTTMLDMDLAYVDTVSPGVDLRCLVGTATTVLTGKGAR
ncbi:MAG: sugar transferase, partial [Acidimicrobiales bacterium]